MRWGRETNDSPRWPLGQAHATTGLPSSRMELKMPVKLSTASSRSDVWTRTCPKPTRGCSASRECRVHGVACCCRLPPRRFMRSRASSVRPPVAEGLSEHLEFLLEPAHADPEDEPAVGEPVHHARSGSSRISSEPSSGGNWRVEPGSAETMARNARTPRGGAVQVAAASGRA